jgi:hypothetical protein
MRTTSRFMPRHRPSPATRPGRGGTCSPHCAPSR